MILIVGGTTEGRIAVQIVEEAGQPYFYSTKRDEQEITLHHGIRISGGMDKEEMLSFCIENQIKIIIDAAHPFAALLHQTVAEVANCLHIPAIRLERKYPPRNKDIHWCNSYEEMIEALQKGKIERWLALTGVQTIGKLKEAWQDNHQTFFRILDRDSSRKIALEHLFPEERLVYYSDDIETDKALFEQLHPQAILIKESGDSGGFSQKIDLALEMGIRVYALKRPELSTYFITVNGPHGLRRKIEKYLPDFYALHSGVTTGSCATAATVAAFLRLATPIQSIASVDITLPNGEDIDIEVASTERLSSTSAKATILKDSGDDPDVTKGTPIVSTVEIISRNKHLPFIQIKGGKGVGRVTMPGLDIPIGEAAINKTPREMINNNIEQLLHLLPIDKDRQSLRVTISVPEGEELAQRTFNPRLGIVGGISIVGTSGIIRPFSSEAFIDSIRKSMSVALATNSGQVVISSGAKSEKFIRNYYPDIPAQAFVHYGNFIGETIKLAEVMHIPQLVLAVMIGKAVKLAEGYMDTHSKKVTMNKEFIKELALRSRCDAPVIQKIEEMNLARELWDIIPPSLLSSFTQEILMECYRHSHPLFPSGKLIVLLISEEGKIYSYSAS